MKKHLKGQYWWHLFGKAEKVNLQPSEEIADLIEGDVSAVRYQHHVVNNIVHPDDYQAQCSVVRDLPYVTSFDHEPSDQEINDALGVDKLADEDVIDIPDEDVVEAELVEAELVEG